MMFKYSEEERVGRNEVKELYRILMSGPQSNALEEFILDIIIQNKRASVDFLVKKDEVQRFFLGVLRDKVAMTGG
jgi:hypothetical protein